MLHDAVACRRVWRGRGYCLAREGGLCTDPGANPVPRTNSLRPLPQTPASRMTNGPSTGAPDRLHALGITMILESVITCPHCATAKSETMPTDACQFFYTCTGCGATLRPKPGDCCVFCSYGSVPCPPIRAERSGEVGAASSCAG